MKANEMRNKQDFVAYLNSIGAIFEETTVNGMEFVYVYDKKAYENKSSFVPYMRVSHFDEEEWYVRYCGYCESYDPEGICYKAEAMTTGEES